MKQNTEQLKKEFEDNFYIPEGDWTNDGAYWGSHDNTEMKEEIWNFFLPHLITSQTTESEEMSKEVTKVEEIKRELLEIEKEIRAVDTYSKRLGGSMRAESIINKCARIVANHFNKMSLTQSKEGGE